MCAAKIATLSVECLCNLDGLLGGEREYAPYLIHYTTFGTTRVHSKAALVQFKADANNPVHDALLQHQQQQKPQKAFWGLANNASQKEEADKLYLKAGQETLFQTAAPLQFTLQDYNQIRGCDALRFEIFSHTRFSGIPEIDKHESKHVQRVITAGTAVLDLWTIFSCYQKQQKEKPGCREPLLIRDGLYDQHCIEDKAREMAEGDRDVTEEEYDAMQAKSKHLTCKGTLFFRVSVNNFNASLFKQCILAVPNLTSQYGFSFPLQQHRLAYPSASTTTTTATTVTERQCADILKAQRHYKDFVPLLYNSEPVWTEMMQTMYGVLTTYCNCFVQLNAEHKPRYAPHEDIYKHLQLMQYASKQGRMPVYAYWAHEPFFSEYPTLDAYKEAMATYGFTEDTERYFHKLLLASLRRHGLSEKHFVHAIKHHYDVKNTEETLTADFLLAEEAIADIGTFAANTAYYTSDLRYIPVANSFDGADHKHATRQEHVHCRRCGNRMEMKMETTDSWDQDILDGTSMCDDCEGQDNTATSIIRSYSIGRPDLGYQWLTPAMEAVRRHLYYTDVIDVGTLVGSPYVNPNAPRATETPIIGDATDRKTDCDGHCFALKLPLSRTIEMVARGKTLPEETIKKMRAAVAISPAFTRRDAKRHVLVLEGTGSVEPRILSLEESYGKDTPLYNKKLAEQLYLKTLRKAIHDDDEQKAGAKEEGPMFCGEGLCFYVKKQDCARRISSFYHSVVHGTSITLMRRFGIALSQVTFAKPVGNTFEYGVRMGELIRDDNNAMVLLCPFAGCEKEWERQVIPMVETIQNQMQVASFGRYTPQQYRDDIYSYFIPKQEITKCKAEPQKPSAAVSCKTTQQNFEALLHRVSTDANLALVRLYSHHWRMTENPERTEALKTRLATSTGIIDYAFYMEKPLSVTDPALLILCVVDVKKCLALQ